MKEESLTKSQKGMVALSILWELLIIALFGSDLKTKMSTFIIYSLPVILYWLGVYIWGFGYLLKFFSATADIDNLKENKNKNKNKNHTLKRIAQFEYEIQHNTHRISFNILAFLFSPFYFLCMGLVRRFILFLFLPVLLGIVLNNFWIAWFISSTIAAFTADIYSKKYKEQYIKKFKTSINMNKPIHFFSISRKRLIFLGILSAGLYFVYWSWRNWKAYKEATNDDVNPALRAWFCHLTMPNLMQKITASLKTSKNYLIYGILFLILSITNYTLLCMIEKTEDPKVIIFYFISSLILLFVIPLLLLPVQKAINNFTEKKLHKTIEKRFYEGEIIFTLLGMLILLAWILSIHTVITLYEKPMLSEFTGQEQKKIRESIVFIYIHTKAYKEICQKEAYTMTKYPQDFKNFFAEDLNKLEKRLNTYNYTIDIVMKELFNSFPELEKKIKMLSYKGLDSIRRNIITRAIAEEIHIKPEDVSWNDSFYDFLSLKDLCAAVDEVGIDELKNGGNRYFFKRYGL